LTPENVLLDLDWNTRISNLGRITFIDTVIDPDGAPRDDAHYLTPECYDRVIVCENDIFSFGLIVDELMAGQPAFSKKYNCESGLSHTLWFHRRYEDRRFFVVSTGTQNMLPSRLISQIPGNTSCDFVFF
jgi:hypothetical protein